ncbi:regulator [Arcobacter sp. CECT 8989]|uniref:PAS domain S-box protein n=1 Tax=Arcobacter sp. CECT 8989 TaxID=2044509 RepID=UPI00100A85A7|nr:PAS domain S-box protein [Arcobacter sp. CECT 8989]RXJ99743.1 regulator [Arcobacter sp. CECT 8989]
MLQMKKELTFLNELNVLYVEDNKFIQEELEFFLSGKVKKLFIASNGEEGLETFKNNQIDLIITDIQMPKMNGLEMSYAIREIDKEAKIIITTAFNDTEYLMEAIKLNLGNYITKPLDLNYLIKIMIESAKNILLEKENKQILNTFEQYRSIVDERSIVSKTDINGIITYVNKPFEEISGYKIEELLGRSHNIIRHEDTPSEVFEEMWSTILDKKVWQGKIKNKKKNGDYYIVDTIIKPILNIDGKIKEFIALRNDITELEMSKEYFKNRNEKFTTNLKDSIRVAKTYKDIVDKSNMIIRIDLDRNISFVNEAFCKVSGYAKDELIGKPYSILRDRSISKEEYEKDINFMFEAMAEKKVLKKKIINQAKDGSIFYCKAILYPLLDRNGEVYEYMGVRHDITDIEKLHKELEDTQRELIYRLGEVGETRSKETGNHVKRVANYSKILARKYGLSKEEESCLFAASPMHDIGKVGIPDEILNKSGKLDENEWEIMKTHAEIGYEILKNSTRSILKAAAVVSYTHHEKWDGSGYPQGLKGEDIHIYGRITAIADVFDALGSDRVYKKAWPLAKILDFFKEQSGKHFDPTLLKMFFDNLDDFLKVRDKYKDNFES